MSIFFKEFSGKDEFDYSYLFDTLEELGCTVTYDDLSDFTVETGYYSKSGTRVSIEFPDGKVVEDIPFRFYKTKDLTSTGFLQKAYLVADIERHMIFAFTALITNMSNNTLYQNPSIPSIPAAKNSSAFGSTVTERYILLFIGEDVDGNVISLANLFHNTPKTMGTSINGALDLASNITANLTNTIIMASASDSYAPLMYVSALKAMTEATSSPRKAIWFDTNRFFYTISYMGTPGQILADESANQYIFLLPYLIYKIN